MEIFVTHQHVQSFVDDIDSDHGLAFLTTILTWWIWLMRNIKDEIVVTFSSLFMIPAFVFHGIACCVTHLYVRNNVEQLSEQWFWPDESDYPETKK
jgi:hypothetical protein